MIFVTVGMQLGFDRLIRAMDALTPRLELPVIAQMGKGSYRPQHMNVRPDFTAAEFEQLIRQAQLIVSHAGIGTILTAARLAKPIVLLPRRADLREHRNDHQRATAQQLAGRPGILLARDENELASRIAEGLALGELPRQQSPTIGHLNTALAAFIENRQA